MTDPEIIRTLAEREGWRLEYHICTGLRLWFHGIDDKGVRFQRCVADVPNNWVEISQSVDSFPPYLTSHDALKPVLAVMTDEEWERFLGQHLGMEGFRGPWAKFYLTLPPRTLAEAVAKSLKG